MVKQYGKCRDVGGGEVVGGDWRKKVGTLLMMECRFVVKLVDLYEDDLFFYVVLELCRGGTMENEIEGKKRVGESFSIEI